MDQNLVRTEQTPLPTDEIFDIRELIDRHCVRSCLGCAERKYPAGLHRGNDPLRYLD